jgi:hypothetical protein
LYPRKGATAYYSDNTRQHLARPNPRPLTTK